MDSAAFAADARTQAAVERKFEIIGEAVNCLHKDHPELARRIPEMRRIVDFRNFLAHGYDLSIECRHCCRLLSLTSSTLKSAPLPALSGLG